MWEHDFGSLPVLTADGRAISVITDRDIAMSACIHGKALGEISGLRGDVPAAGDGPAHG